ncbi:ParM/StbA family protein [Paenibacillus alvei]|uniref:ParM/StbA family protein n=1 Tax=Paenibacillus alvei TaxID=44250 RepID=UPI0013DCB9EE|nr:ParM/StbA family protein [Paenibacillus alvei]
METSVSLEVVEPIGGDLGNDSLKIAFDAKKFLTIKNAVSRRLISEKRKEDLSMDIDGNFDESSEEKMLKNLDVIIRPANGQEERFYVGDYAIAAGEDETIVGTMKADNPYIHVPLLAVLAYRTPKSKKEAHFKGVFGLPIKQFTKDGRQKMKQRLVGEFDVTLMDARGERGRTVKIFIHDVTIAPEGVPVLMNQMLNNEANDIARPELRVGSRGVIDIGAFTTDIPVIVNGKPDSMASTGIDEGIATYIDKIAKSLSESTRATITRNQILDKIMNDDTEEISIRGKKYPLRKEVEDQLNFFAKKIVDVIDALWSKNFEIEEFFVVGGGGKLLRPYLEKNMAAVDMQLTFIEPKNKSDFQNDPQLQNAFGYWKLARQKYGA